MAIVGGSLGTIRTMAGDLALEKGKRPRKIEVPQTPPTDGSPQPASPTPPGGISPMAGRASRTPSEVTNGKQITEPSKTPLSQKNLEELLPLEDFSDVEKEKTIHQTKTMPQQPQQRPQPQKKAYGPTPPPAGVFSGASTETVAGGPQSSLEPNPSQTHPTPDDDRLREEVFPAPDIKKDFTKPPPPSPASASSGAPSEAVADGLMQSPQKEGGMSRPPSPPPNLPGAKEEKKLEKLQEIDTDAEIPTETPEELLGMEGGSEDETTPVTRPDVGEAAPNDGLRESSPSPPAGGDSGTTPPPPIQTERGFDKVPSRKKAFGLRRFIMIGGAIFVALLVGGGVFYYTALRPSEIPPAPQPPPPSGGSSPQTTFIPPAPLVTPDFIQEIIVENFAQETIMEALETLVLNEYPQQSITYLPIRLSQTTPENKSIYLDAPTFFTSLNIETPQGMLDVIEKQFMLYIYGPSEQEQAFCEAGGITDETCWGPRLGFVLQGHQILLGAFLSQWAALEREGGWRKPNLYRLILSDAKSIPENTGYTTTEYQGLTIESPRTIEITYINFPISTMTFNFAIVDEFFVFATSKNALSLMLDRIMQE